MITPGLHAAVHHRVVCSVDPWRFADGAANLRPSPAHAGRSGMSPFRWVRWRPRGTLHLRVVFL